MIVCLRLAIASALSAISLALLTFLLVLVLPLLTRAFIWAVTAQAARALSCLDSVLPCPLMLFILLQASWARVFTIGLGAAVK